MTRTEPPYAADEREMLLAHLEFERESCVLKLEGLTEEQGRISPRPGGNSLMALVKHLRADENWWFRVCFNGETDAELYPEDPDADLRISEQDTVPELIALYRAEWQIANEIVRAAGSLDDEAKYTSRTDGVPTLRWILNHMLEETARHAGHADITRELIDGSVGM